MPTSLFTSWNPEKRQWIVKGSGYVSQPEQKEEQPGRVKRWFLDRGWMKQRGYGDLSITELAVDPQNVDGSIQAIRVAIRKNPTYQKFGGRANTDLAVATRDQKPHTETTSSEGGYWISWATGVVTLAFSVANNFLSYTRLNATVPKGIEAISHTVMKNITDTANSIIEHAFRLSGSSVLNSSDLSTMLENVSASVTSMAEEAINTAIKEFNASNKDAQSQEIFSTNLKIFCTGLAATVLAGMTYYMLFYTTQKEKKQGQLAKLLKDTEGTLPKLKDEIVTKEQALEALDKFFSRHVPIVADDESDDDDAQEYKNFAVNATAPPPTEIALNVMESEVKDQSAPADAAADDDAAAHSDAKADPRAEIQSGIRQLIITKLEQEDDLDLYKTLLKTLSKPFSKETADNLLLILKVELFATYKELFLTEATTAAKNANDANAFRAAMALSPLFIEFNNIQTLDDFYRFITKPEVVAKMQELNLDPTALTSQFAEVLATNLSHEGTLDLMSKMIAACNERGVRITPDANLMWAMLNDPRQTNPVLVEVGRYVADSFNQVTLTQISERTSEEIAPTIADATVQQRLWSNNTVETLFDAISKLAPADEDDAAPAPGH